MRTLNPTRTPLAEQVIRLRTARGWTQQELASRAGLSISVVRTLEAAGIVPRVDTLRRLRELFFMGYDQLLAEPPAFTDEEIAAAYEETARVQARARAAGDRELERLAKTEGKRLLQLMAAAPADVLGEVPDHTTLPGVAAVVRTR